MPDNVLIKVLKKNTLLTKREKEIMMLASEGLLRKEMAEKLFISHGTVKKHFDNIFFKLEVKNTIETLNSIKHI